MTDATDTVLTLVLALRDEASASLGVFNGRLAEQKVMLDAANAKTAEASAVQGRYAASLDRAALASDRETAAALKAADRQIAAAQRVTVAVAREQEKQSAAITAAATTAAKSLSLIGVGAAGIIYQTSKMAASFQQNMEMIRTQAGASQTEVDRLTPQVIQLSSVVGFGPTSLAESLYHAESAGYREAAALAITTSAAKLAQIGHADLETTTQALVGVMSSHIKGVRDAAEATAYLNSIVGIGDMRLNQLAQSIGTGVLPSFKNFGLGIRDFGAAIATLTDNLVPADEAATRLRMTVALLGAPSGAAAKALEAVGISASDANAALSHRDELAKYGIHLTDLSTDLRKPDGLLVALEDLKKHLADAGLSATEQGAVLTRAFGGGRSSAAILTLYNELDRLKSKYADLGTGVKKFGDDWNATTKTTAFEAAQAKANFDAFGITVGTAVVPAVSEFLKVITPAAQELAKFTADHKEIVAAALGGAAAIGGAAALVLALVKVKNAFIAIETAAKSARVAEIAAFAASPAGIAVAITAFASYEAHQKTVSDNLDAMRSAEARLTTEYDKGNISTDQARKILTEFNVIAKLGTGDVVDLTLAKLEDSKVKYQDHITLEANALHHLGAELTDSVGYWHAATDAKKAYYQFDGKGAAALSPGASDPAKAASKTPLEDLIAKVDKAIPVMAEKVAADGAAYGKHSVQVEDDTRKLDALKAQSVELHKEWTDLTTTTKALKTAGLDPFQSGLQKAQAALQKATDAIAEDGIKGLPVTAAQRQAFNEATASVKQYQAAQDAADGTTAAREAARAKKEAAAADARQKREDEASKRLHDKEERLALAAEKAYKALLDVAHASELVAGNQGAEAAHRAGLYNLQQGPPGYPSGGTEAQQAAYSKAHSMDFYHQFPSEVSSLIGRPNEMKVEGITPAQLLADPVVKKYLETLTEQKLKALGFTPGQLATIPGTAEWQKKQPIDTTVVAQLPGARFGQSGQPTAGSPSIGNLTSGGLGSLFPGIIAGGIKLRDTFEQQVQAGLDQIKTSKDVEKVNLEVARRSGDTATVFSILDKKYLEGTATLAQVDQAYKANQGTILSSTRRQIDYDKSIGDTGDELTKTLELYHQGNATLAESEQAYNDNAAAVAKVTAQDLLFLEGTGQWSAALASISTSLTGPLGDATAKLTYDFLTHSGDIEADTKAVQDHQAALDALTQATWDAQFTAANPAQQSQMLNTLAQPMISQQSSEASAAQAMNTAQLGVIAAESALEVQGINAMTTQLADMGGIIKAASALQTAQFSGQLAALNDLIPIQNDLAAIQKATTPQLLQAAQEQLKIDRLTAAMNQNKASWDVKIAQMTLQLAQEKMMVDMANAAAQRTIAVDNLVLAGDALNVQIASAKLQSDSLVIQNAIHTDLGGVRDYLNLIDGDLQNLTDAQNQQLSDQQNLGYDTAAANEIAASGAGLLGGDQLGIDSATAAATAANQAYQLQLAQYKVEQNSQQNLQQLVANSTADNAALLSEVKTLQNLIAFQNSPASRRPLRSVGNVSTAAMINSWAATAAATQAA